MKKALMILFSLILLNGVPAYSNETEEKEQTNKKYCESIYWEDEDNCTFIQADHLVDTEFCNSIPFESTRATCLEAVKEIENQVPTEDRR